jgi:hypothetical protein
VRWLELIEPSQTTSGIRDGGIDAKLIDALTCTTASSS